MVFYPKGPFFILREKIKILFMNYEEIIKKLKSWANRKNIEGMVRFGISSKNTLGVPIPKLRSLAKKIGKNHELAQKLWNSKIHEARILAGFIDISELVAENQLEKWVKDFDSWDVCDQVCSNLFDKTKFAYKKATEWSKRKEEFVKRAGFTLMACLAVHNKKAKDKDFERFFPMIKKESIDERNFVKKAVNWALRQIGKRNSVLNKKTIKLAKEIQKIDSKSAKWIAGDAIRELSNKKFKRS
ncbi:MAG: DNA alkylation repair protein [Candidatus Paceibacterota bacterium]|jgi:3-methyladenine DNA glycosylase AlkD